MTDPKDPPGVFVAPWLERPRRLTLTFEIIDRVPEGWAEDSSLKTFLEHYIQDSSGDDPSDHSFAGKLLIHALTVLINQAIAASANQVLAEQAPVPSDDFQNLEWARREVAKRADDVHIIDIALAKNGIKIDTLHNEIPADETVSATSAALRPFQTVRDGTGWSVVTQLSSHMHTHTLRNHLDEWQAIRLAAALNRLVETPFTLQKCPGCGGFGGCEYCAPSLPASR
jgi:hypothetical protein